MVLLKTMAILLCKEVLYFENLQITYCGNYGNIPGYGYQQAHFCDCCRNMAHFLCGVVV